MADNIVLNTTYKPIPVGFTITALSKDEKEVIGLSDLANSMISKIRITNNLDELDECSMSFEYSASHDGYKGKGELPPWVIFQGLRDQRIRYGISYKFINDDPYYVRYIDANLQEIFSRYKTEIGAFETLIKPAATVIKTALENGIEPDKTKKDELNNYIINFLAKLRGLDDDIARGNISHVKIDLNEAYLFKGYPVTNTFSGTEDGVIKFDVTLHDRLTVTSLRKSNIANRVATQLPVGFSYANEAELCAFLNDVLNNQERKLSDFVALLFGYTKQGLVYKPGRYLIPSNLSTVFTLGGGTSIVTDPASRVVFSNRELLQTELDALKYKLDFSNLDQDFKTFMLDLDNSNLKQTINAAGGGAFLNSRANVVARNILQSITDANVFNETQREAARMNLQSLRTGYVRSIKAFIQKAASTRTSELSDYLNLIRTFFGIERDIHHNGTDGYNVVRLMTKSPDRGNSKDTTIIKTASEIRDRLIVLEYGGAVVNFSHSIKTAGISIKNLKSGKSSVSLSLDNAYSINIELSDAAIRQYAEKVYKLSNAQLENYIAYIQKAIKENPDEFLLNFISYSVGVRDNVIKPEEGLGSRQGNQSLTLTLRNPIPILGRGTPIFFTTLGDEKEESTTVTSIATTATGRGFYILPDKVRGFYIVTKVTHTFNAKENIWSQTVECER